MPREFSGIARWPSSSIVKLQVYAHLPNRQLIIHLPFSLYYRFNGTDIGVSRCAVCDPLYSTM